MTDDFEIIEANVAKLVPHIVALACGSKSAAVLGFEVGLHDAIEGVIKRANESDLVDGVEPATLAEMARIMKNSLWRQVLIELDDIRGNPEKQKKLMLPAALWTEEAEKVGRDFGAKIAMDRPMPEKKARKLERSLQTEVEALARRLSNSWPLSDETRDAVILVLQDAAVGSAMDFLSRVAPLSHIGGRA